MTAVSRRELLRDTGLGLAGIALGNPGISAAQTGWPGIDDAILINGLGMLSNPNTWIEAARQGGNDLMLSQERRRMIDARVLADARASGTTAVDDLEAYRDITRRELEERRAAGIAAPGENPGAVPFVPDLPGPGQFQKLADMLYRRGHSSARIEKILGGNFLRLFEQIRGG